jgi:hypothetical protein
VFKAILITNSFIIIIKPKNENIFLEKKKKKL